MKRARPSWISSACPPAPTCTNQVSASMMQRIAVSRAFAVNPDLLLMDEPCGQLDVKLRFYLEDELVNIWKSSTVPFCS